MSRQVVVSSRSELRIREAAAWLASRPAHREVIVIGGTADAAGELIRAVALQRGSAFGMHRLTLGRVAAELAKHALVELDLATVGGLPIEALCARVVQRLRREGTIGRLDAVSTQPGLPRALARTLLELRMAGAGETALGVIGARVAIASTELDITLGTMHLQVAQTIVEVQRESVRADDGGLDALPRGSRAQAQGANSDVARALIDRAGHPELAAGLRALEAELAAANLADRALVYRIATDVAADRTRRGSLMDLDLVVLDAPIRSIVEQRLVAALVARAPAAFATIPAGDDRSGRHLAAAFGVAPEVIADPGGTRSLHRVQADLFAPRRERASLDDSLEIFSAPGESRECVEIARRVLQATERGIPFDRMAVLLRSPEAYRVHLEEALSRANIPVHFDQGTRLPDPTGRAFLALLACADEDLSAKRFAEYISLGEVPLVDVPPPAAPPGDRWVPPEEELLPIALANDDAADDELGSVQVRRGATPQAEAKLGTVFAPWRWEQLLVDASVIGGIDRWKRRLAGLEAQLRLDDSESGRDRRVRALGDLEQLRQFALPLVEDLANLPEEATWGGWIEKLSALASRALRKPERVISVLSALVPMAEVGPIALREVQLVLTERLADLVVRRTVARYGALLVAPIEAARGRSFDLVFVPGLAERMFPQKLTEDPLLLDSDRTKLLDDALGLERREDRLAEERLALRLAIGAATERVVLSYPRIDLEQGRPRVPSFYGLEVLEAGEGELPGFDELGRRANVTGAARIGWP
ncbi:MAG TPA: hypothetical protein VGC41_08280, partial [Kofleriaceae bacterium]